MTIFRKKIWPKNTDFVNFGTYRAEEADILKHDTPFYFMDTLLIFFFLWLCSTAYNIFTEEK